HQAKAWYYGVGKPTPEQCARYKETMRPAPTVQKSCPLSDPTVWASEACDRFGLEPEFVCFTCVEQPDPVNTIRNLLAYDGGCTRGVFMYSINFDLRHVL